MRVPVREVPLEVRRAAAQHLESLRGTELMRGLEFARLGEEAVPIHRPDVDGIAYWEFWVVGGGQIQGLKSRNYAVPAGHEQTGAVASAPTAGRPIGFIVASNGRHDFPIAHWSLDRLPPSLQVSAMDQAACAGEVRQPRESVRLYRLDSLSYVGEDAAGEIAGQSGQIPSPIRGLPHDLSRFAGRIASSIARVLRAERTDDTAENATHEVERSDHDVPSLTRTDDGGWKALKETYADAFGPLLDQLRTRASRTWEIEDARRKFGEGIIAGTTERVALLGEARVELSGDGARYVRATIDDNGPPALVLEAAAASLPHEVEFQALVAYQNGERERLPFFIVSRDVPSNTKAERERTRSTDCEE